MPFFELPDQIKDPRQTLARASRWLGAFGGVLTVLGLIAMIMSFTMAEESSARFGRVLRGLGALGGWLVPGLVYLLCAIAIPRRMRWAIVAADVTTYVQLFFAGALVVISLLNVKGMWPMLLVGLAWVGPLLLVPKVTAPCSRAMDLIAQLPTLGAGSGAALRKSRRP